MASYDAIVSWTADGDFVSGRYSRAHELRFDGGAVVRGSSSPHVVPVYSDPAGVDPEELLVASAAACHMLWFLALAQAAGFDVASYRDAPRGSLGKDDRGRTALTRIELDPDIVFIGAAPDAAALTLLHADAHERCFIANSLRGEVVVAAARE